MTMTFYCYPKCGTCKKAKQWLEANGVAYDEHHIVEDTPSKAVMMGLIERSGLDIKKFFNTSGQKYRELNLKDKLPDMTHEEKVDVLVSDGMLMKRPLTYDDQHVTVGFKEEQFEQTWK
ncbi:MULTISPECIES: arsenate reductase family protein [Halolactibacillus]|uniref:arsenate reductase family protein n=1 Tax=Halolactibacillus TaxID=306539 RepID=UPI00078032CB|nr:MULTISPECIES: arsenate reductase family protein [Halolactibacillus]